MTLLEGIPLSGADLLSMANKLGNSNTAWIPYQDLSRYKNLTELFSSKPGLNTVFVLLQILNEGPKPVVGHWISLSINSEGGLSYYDPYGLTPEQDITVTGESDLLLRLLDGVRVDVNRARHQEVKSKQNECGRHTVVRSLFVDLSNKQYNDLIIVPAVQSKLVGSADVLVTLLTGFLSQSDVAVKMILDPRNAPSTPQTYRGHLDDIAPPGIGLGGRVV